MPENTKIYLHKLGRKPYRETWDFQKELFQKVIDQKLAIRRGEAPEHAQTENHMLIVEHPHVYTLGKSGNQNHLLINEDFLKSINATYEHIERGGDITYHGPGQLVLYPILDLDNFFTDIHKFMRYLEEAVIRSLADWGIEAGRVEKLTGVWIENSRKICAMGVKLSRWVSMHGLALNVNTDLSYFNHIVPCGIQDKAVTSMEKELGYKVDWNEVAQRLVLHFEKLFEANLVEEV